VGCTLQGMRPTGKEINIKIKAKAKQLTMKDIKSKREQIRADTVRTSIKSTPRPMAHITIRHSSQFVPPYNSVSQAQVTPLRWLRSNQLGVSPT
jgi:hypothetical protein